MNRNVTISFPKTSDAEGNKLAESLSTYLSTIDSSISVRKLRTNPNSLDGGATIAIILGSAAVTAVAKGVAVWLAKHAGTNIEIHKADGTSVVVRNAQGADTAATVAAVFATKD
jgi:hypothetical protein